MPPAIGYCETTSPKTSATSSWPVPTMTSQKIEGGPPVLRASAKREYTPTSGERYVKPSAKFAQSDIERLKESSYPSTLRCSVSPSLFLAGLIC